MDTMKENPKNQSTSDTLVAVATIEVYFEDTHQEQGKINCPICKAKDALSYTRGQKCIWAKCRTKDCVNFHADLR